MALEVGLIAGLFSLLGAFAGAALMRRTQYEKWLLENRSTVYSKFLDLIQKSRNEASENLLDKTLEELEADIKVTEAYMPTTQYARIVRLYLPSDDRESFTKLVSEVWAAHASIEKKVERYKVMNTKLDEIQSLFEASLKSANK